MIANKELSEIRELIKLTVDFFAKAENAVKAKAFYGHDVNYMATILIHRGLFLENLPFLPKIARTGWRIYSHILNEYGEDHFDNLAIGYYNECLVKLVESKPMKSYLRLSFRQFINFLLSRGSGGYLMDMHYLTSFVNEIRTSYSTLCYEDRQILKPTSKIECSQTFTHGIHEDASFLLNWSSIEAAKYCICHKFAPDMSANKFLNLLQKEIMSPVVLGDKVSRQILINFLQILDRFLLDRTIESSTGKHTFNGPTNIEQFYKANCSIFRSWFLKNRQDISRLSLVLDEPAECWRNTSYKLFQDLANKYHGTSSSSQDPSFSQTLMSLNTKNWYSNLSLIVSSARQLKDLPLLYGIQSLTEFQGFICEYPPLSAVISNLEGSYQKTYDLLKDCDDLEERQVLEFLESCVELNILEENKDHIERLKSETMRSLYEKYLESKCCENEIEKSRLEEVERWLTTWQDLNGDETNKYTETQPIMNYINLVIPTCLNIIAKVPKNERLELIERVEWLVSQDFIALCLFPPNLINENIKVYHLLFELLKDEKTSLPEDIVQLHANDLRWNHLLYRHLCDINVIDRLRKQGDQSLDLIQLRAIKFNQKHRNIALAKRISNDLTENGQSYDVKAINSLLLVTSEDAPYNQKCDLLHEVALKIKKSSSKVTSPLRYDLITKALRDVMRLPETAQTNNEIKLFEAIHEPHERTGNKTNETAIDRWKNFLDSSSLLSRTKTLLLFSKHSNEQLLRVPDNDTHLNSTFGLDLKLLESVCQSNIPKHKSSALECATRLLNLIVSGRTRLNNENLEHFRSDDFVQCTLNTWVVLKTNLISLLSYRDDIGGEWREALIKIVKSIGQQYPNLLIYSIIVNRLDLENELLYLNDESLSASLDIKEPCTFLLRNNCTTSESNNTAKEAASIKLKDCQRELTLWNELFNHIKTSSDHSENKWSDIVLETERFLKEIRKISYLCGEYFRTITVRISKRLHNFIEYFSRFCDSKTGIILNQQRLEECEKRLKNVCDQAINPVKILLTYGQRIGDPHSHLTVYDFWFGSTFKGHLRELEYRLNLLAKKKPLVLGELEKLVKSITELLHVCRNTLLVYNQSNRHKLYMEMISPVLSRLKPSLIPMPDCCNEISNSTKPIVTIHKISQTVNLIVSKTSPKKLKFIGSDGVCRSFLLKAHEDLRLDHLIMELFASINILLLGPKETRNKFRLRRYSVTPVSSRSGLIQWIEAPSLCSSYRAWLNGPNGKKVVEELYSSTCKSLCQEEEANSPLSSHTHCQPPQNSQSVNLFYQLLWARTKPTKHPLTQTKPFVGNIVKYRNEFDASIFRGIVEQLINRMPKELVANQLWYKSNNSLCYWRKTQELIHSCATISMVGYIIGLGDRHPENILLDYNTGEVIHIDYNICFELGKTLSIPEQVPFRLTQNLIHAFGFAGLEGGFKLACRSVLDTLKSCKPTLLHLLDPINLSFMIGQQTKSSDETKDASRVNNYHRMSTNMQNLKLDASATALVSVRSKATSEMMDMCSQESVELNSPNANDVSDLLILNNSPKGQQVHPSHDPIVDVKPIRNHATPNFDLQYNIKTPTKILSKTAQNIYERISDKLSGTDECIRHYKCQLLNVDSEPSSVEASEKASDLIMLNDAQSTEDQVDALIIEATSIKNKAAMFEGWVPWI